MRELRGGEAEGLRSGEAQKWSAISPGDPDFRRDDGTVCGLGKSGAAHRFKFFKACRAAFPEPQNIEPGTWNLEAHLAFPPSRPYLCNN